MRRPLVYVESPFAGDRVANRSYLKKCIQDCLKRGENPYASHAFFTQFLDDNNPKERRLGIMLGEMWRLKCDYTVFYIDRGMSEGMWGGYEACQIFDLKWEVRFIL